MFKLFIIIFREILEVSIILGIISAATKNIPGRTKYILSGIAVGVFGALIIAFFTSAISDLFDGYGQELLNALILLVTASMIIWTVVWMKQHSCNFVSKMKDYKQQLSSQSAPLFSIAIITATSVFREGSEIVLFTYGIAISSNYPIYKLFFGGIMGFTAAFILGLAIYKGMIKISPKYLFKTTSIILGLIAAGLSAQAANFLSAGEIITVMQQQVWSTSQILPQESDLGKLLNVLIGYSENPTMIELVFYLSTLGIIFLLSFKCKKKPAHSH